MKKLFSILPILMLAVVLVSTVAAGKKSVNLYLVGDGTIAQTSAHGEQGWGQALSTYLQDNVVIKSYAQPDASTKTSIDNGTWDRLLVNLHRGDVVLVQYGHNDEQETNKEQHASIAEIEKTLYLLTKAIKKERAKVVLCTPIARRVYNEHTESLADTHGAYSEAIRRVAEASETPLIDLTTITMKWLNSNDKEVSAKYYADDTHLTEEGAAEVARLAIEAAKKQELKALVKIAK